ncbi:hypothetical protein [Bacillus paramycoides]|uniref:hypothetical protein n=1 Tax=Bacillus paramycoides TaxID=2026194 RepID=UPI002E1CAB93|nr:hypothetical protein [Bacillus paramycoides]
MKKIFSGKKVKNKVMATLLAASALGMGLSAEPASAATNSWDLQGHAIGHGGLVVRSQGNVIFEWNKPGEVRFEGWASLISEDAFDSGTLNANLNVITEVQYLGATGRVSNDYTYPAVTRNNFRMSGGNQVIASRQINNSLTAWGVIQGAKVWPSAYVNYNNGAFQDDILTSGDRGL